MEDQVNEMGLPTQAIPGNPVIADSVMRSIIQEQQRKGFLNYYKHIMQKSRKKFKAWKKR